MPDQAVILLVEDREDDVFLIRKAFERAGLSNPVQVVRDGEQAISYLAGERKFSNRAEYPLPWLILLDLKMPRVDGFEVLRWIRKQPGFNRIVVIVLTSSEEIRDVNRAYQLGANLYLAKPVDWRQFRERMRLMGQIWMEHAQTPHVA